jgi:hypothetical protein
MALFVDLIFLFFNSLVVSPILRKFDRPVVTSGSLQAVVSKLLVGESIVSLARDTLMNQSVAAATATDYDDDDDDDSFDFGQPIFSKASTIPTTSTATVRTLTKNVTAPVVRAADGLAGKKDQGKGVNEQ